jgi:exosortase
VRGEATTFQGGQPHSWHARFFGACIGSLFLYSYWNVFLWMYGRFTAEDTYYSHGFLVPFVTGYLIWRKREKLRSLPEDSSGFGFLLVLLGLLIHVCSTLFFVFFPSGFSILLVLFGLALFLRGKEFTKEIFVPLIFLLFMIPAPMDAINKIGFPLKMMVANFATTIVSLAGISVFRTGFFIETARGVLVVDNPCSGLRSLITFLALGFLLAHIIDTARWKKALLFLSTIPIAIFTNILRVTFLVLVSHYYGPDYAVPNSLPHDVSGYVAFAIGGVLLFSLGRVFDER